MNLQSSTSLDLIAFNVPWGSKDEIIQNLIDLMAKHHYVSDKVQFKKAVLARESLSETGMENGFAIPHGKSAAVKKACFAVARLSKPLPKGTWESFDEDNQVELVFLLAIPDTEAGSTHLKILADLSTSLMNNDFVQRLKSATSAKALWEALNIKEDSPKAQESSMDDKPYKGKKILAITACATGIAHTYMAAEALEKAATQLGIEIQVEKQGANGIENALTEKQIKEADGILFAVDTKVKNKERFAGKPYVQTKVAEPLKNSNQLLIQVLEHPDGLVAKTEANSDNNVAKSNEKKSVLSEITAGVMTGISYMIPLLVAGGLMMGIAKLIWVYILQLDVSTIGSADFNNVATVEGFVHYLDAFGGMIFKFIYPIFSMFLAYAIADRVGIVSGFVGGMFATGLHYTFWGIQGGIPSGFLGALVLGIAAGYTSKWLNEHIKLSKNLIAMKPMFLVPGLSVFVIFVLNMFLVDPVFGGLNAWMASTIAKMSDSGQLTLSAIIAAATAFDLGGPINKAAGAVAIGMAADKVFPLTPRVLAIVIPPIGLGLATMMDKYIVGRRVFSEDLRVVGNTSFLLGFLAISEGAIPFMLKNPLITIPINIIGAILGACTAVLLGAVQWLPLPAIWGWPLVENFPAYLIGLLVGTFFIAFANIFVRFAIILRNEKK